MAITLYFLLSPATNNSNSSFIFKLFSSDVLLEIMHFSPVNLLKSPSTKLSLFIFLSSLPLMVTLFISSPLVVADKSISPFMFLTPTFFISSVLKKGSAFLGEITISFPSKDSVIGFSKLLIAILTVPKTITNNPVLIAIAKINKQNLAFFSNMLLAIYLKNILMNPDMFKGISLFRNPFYYFLCFYFFTTSQLLLS